LDSPAVPPFDDLVPRLRAGDATAYQEALRRHGAPVFGFLLRLARKHDVAEDLFQETWLSLARHASRLRDDTRLEAWLFKVARNAYRSHRRWQWVDPSRWLLAEEDETAASRAPSPEDQADAGQRMARIEDALGRVSADDRELLLLISVDGLSPAEVAVIMSTSQEALRQRLARARKALARALSTPPTSRP
jgi:RNA polymerase sigma-70 factor (ECF subfamily)